MAGRKQLIFEKIERKIVKNKYLEESTLNDEFVIMEEFSYFRIYTFVDIIISGESMTKL